MSEKEFGNKGGVGDEDAPGGLPWKYIIILLVLLVMFPGGFYIYKYIEKSDPNYYMKHQKMGEEFFRKGFYDQAAEEFQKAAEVRPESLESNYGLALSYLRDQKYEEAIVSFEKTVKIAPDRVDVRYSLGVAYQQTGRLEKALNEYHNVAEKDPKSFQVFNNAGTIYAKMGDFDKAIKAFEASIRRNPNYYPAYFGLAGVYESQGKKDLAIKQYQYVKERASQQPKTENFVRLAEQRLAELSTPPAGSQNLN